MPPKIYISATNCITPLGLDVASNANALYEERSAIALHQNAMMPKSYYSAIISDQVIDSAFSEIANPADFSRLEKMMILALSPVVNRNHPQDIRTGFILSTTKGNINALFKENGLPEAQLHFLAKKIAGFFGFVSQPIVISNACVSGIMAVSVAKRLICSGMYDRIYIVAGDEVSEFVLSGFSSFQAMSDAPCKPYSKNRSGVTLGEAAAAALVTNESADAKVEILGDGSMNDANHISGPSRTGEGLLLSIKSALDESGIDTSEIGYISAHGTATPYNDEMEAIAFNRLGLQDVPLNSLKGYYGHTLGASGLLEVVMAIESVAQGRLFRSLGYDESGVSVPLNVIQKAEKEKVRYFLKTASGFGGCNTAVIFGTVDGK
ncbi:MAG: beta-ketoacyl synthase [Flavobacterium sp.]|nr:MAG: beta-ketoacyl synthase [Flavobacterium sp.]